MDPFSTVMEQLMFEIKKSGSSSFPSDFTSKLPV
jgi:hypothetical protein